MTTIDILLNSSNIVLLISPTCSLHIICSPMYVLVDRTGFKPVISINQMQPSGLLTYARWTWGESHPWPLDAHPLDFALWRYGESNPELVNANDLLYRLTTSPPSESIRANKAPYYLSYRPGKHKRAGLPAESRSGSAGLRIPDSALRNRDYTDKIL